MECARKRLFLWIVHACVRTRECSYMYLYVGVSSLSQQLIGLLLGLCLDIILKILFFSFQALVSVLDSQHISMELMFS